MKIDFPPPSLLREPLGSGQPKWPLIARPFGVLLAVLLGCGGSSVDPSSEPEGCGSDAECGDGLQCVDSACVAASPPASTSAGAFACSVVRCPASQPSCCLSVEASATGNESQGYAIRNEMVVSADAIRGEVRAGFIFDAPDQQGWVTFELASELDLDRLDFTGRHDGVADEYLTVNTNRSEESGCAFGFQLEFRPSPTGQGPGAFGNGVSFTNDAFCYGGARPGRARELAFAIFSIDPGEASLVISNITLRE